MTVAAIIQARMGSSRLPGKVIERIASKMMVEHVLERAKKISGVDIVVCAIPEDANLSELIFAAHLGVIIHQGPEHDVLSRYVGAAQAVGADIIMRITADCPLLDPEVCGKVLRALVYTGADYASNLEPRTYPQGLDCEAFTMEALLTADLLATKPEDREHVTTIMRRDEAKLRRVSVNNDIDLSAHRWTVDTADDLECVRAIWARGEPTDLAATLAIAKAM